MSIHKYKIENHSEPTRLMPHNFMNCFSALTGNPKDEKTTSDAERKHHPLLVKILAEKLEVARECCDFTRDYFKSMIRAVL